MLLWSSLICRFCLNRIFLRFNLCNRKNSNDNDKIAVTALATNLRAKSYVSLYPSFAVRMSSKHLNSQQEFPTWKDLQFWKVIYKQDGGLGVLCSGATYLWWWTENGFTPPWDAFVAYTKGARVGSWYIVQTLGNNLGMDVYAMPANTFTYTTIKLLFKKKRSNKTYWLSRSPPMWRSAPSGAPFPFLSTFYTTAALNVACSQQRAL